MTRLSAAPAITVAMRARGVALAVVVLGATAVGGRWLAGMIEEHALPGLGVTPASPVMLAILIAVVLTHAWSRLVDAIEPVLQRCTSAILQLGVVLLGIKLSLGTVSAVGATALPVVLTCVTLALVTVIALSRMLGVSRELGLLIAVGTSICGMTAIAATAPLIRARSDEVSYAVACVAVFGLVGLLALPALAHMLFPLDAQLAGIFIGTSVHDTSQVAGAALAYEQRYAVPTVLETAIVTKLMRNLCMTLVVPLAALAWRGRVDAAAPVDARTPRRPLVPMFILGFAAMCALRTIGDLGSKPFGLMSPDTWSALREQVQIVAEWLLTIAMAAVGLQTRFAGFRQLGWRPFVLALGAAALVGVVSALSLMVR